jgi:hypothetical protein
MMGFVPAKRNGHNTAETFGALFLSKLKSDQETIMRLNVRCQSFLQQHARPSEY